MPDDATLRTRATYDAIALALSSRTRAIVRRHQPMARPLRRRVAGGRAGRRPWRGAGDRHRRTPPSRAPRVQPRLLDGHAATLASRSTRAHVCKRMRGGCPSAPARLRASGRALRCSTSRDLTARRRSRTPAGRSRRADGCSSRSSRATDCETETARYGMPRFFQDLVRLRARRGARRRRVPRHRRRDGDIAARRMARQAGRADRLTPRYAGRVSGISRRGSSRRTRLTGSASRSRRAGTRCRGHWRA